MNKSLVDALKDVTYINHASLVDGRNVNLMPFWDGIQWHYWIPNDSNGLSELNVADVIEVNYVAYAPACEQDIIIPFVELMWQRMNYPGVCPIIRAISEDFLNMGTCVAKLQYFYLSRNSFRNGEVERFASTELEYLIILARSVFDLLQEIVSILWDQHIQFHDEGWEKRRKGRKLPESFSKMIFCNKQTQTLRTDKEFESKYAIPTQVAAAYSKHAQFFSALRNSRDYIVHGYSEMGNIFVTEKGFCVSPQAKPFSSYAHWKKDHYYNENVVSILPWVANVIQGTIDACNDLMNSVSSVLKLPPELASGFHVYVKGPSTRNLLDVIQLREGGSPWWCHEESK